MFPDIQMTFSSVNMLALPFTIESLLSLEPFFFPVQQANQVNRFKVFGSTSSSFSLALLQHVISNFAYVNNHIIKSNLMNSNLALLPAVDLVSFCGQELIVLLSVRRHLDPNMVP